jgi:DNA-binding MarR family transcriptional regulator
MNTPKELFLMQQTYATLFSIANKLQVYGDKYFKSMTSRQLMAMIAVVHLPADETTLNNIARKLGTTKQSVKQIISIIERKGYVTLAPSRKDKRAVNVHVTALGEKVAWDCAEKSLVLLNDLFKEFSAREMEMLWRFLKKLYRFDGEEQDGFEEEPVLEMNEEQKKTQKRALNEFSKRRKDSLKKV